MDLKDRKKLLAIAISGENRTAPVGSELAQESQVVVEEEADVVDPVLQHGDAFDAQPEGEAGVGFRVVAHGLEDRGVDHAGAQDLQPAGGLADPAAVAPDSIGQLRKFCMDEICLA